MVQSWFIHKILAEHKRRGLHSSRPVTRYTWRKRPVLFCPAEGHSHWPLIRIRYFFCCIKRICRLTWIQCLSPAGQSLLPGRWARRRQRRRAPQPPPHRAMQRYEWLCLIHVYHVDIYKAVITYDLPCGLQNASYLHCGGGGLIDKVLINWARLIYFS